MFLLTNTLVQVFTTQPPLNGRVISSVQRFKTLNSFIISWPYFDYLRTLNVILEHAHNCNSSHLLEETNIRIQQSKWTPDALQQPLSRCSKIISTRFQLHNSIFKVNLKGSEWLQVTTATYFLWTSRITVKQVKCWTFNSFEYPVLI